jgi:hypothetical protein
MVDSVSDDMMVDMEEEKTTSKGYPRLVGGGGRGSKA